MATLCAPSFSSFSFSLLPYLHPVLLLRLFFLLPHLQSQSRCPRRGRQNKQERKITSKMHSEEIGFSNYQISALAPRQCEAYE
eukprot:5732397-Pyramimonas_sp.AAC.2